MAYSAGRRARYEAAVAGVLVNICFGLAYLEAHGGLRIVYVGLAVFVIE